MGAEGGIRTWLEEGKMAESKQWFTSEINPQTPRIEIEMINSQQDKSHYDQAFSSGYAAPSTGTMLRFKISMKQMRKVKHLLLNRAGAN